MNTQKKRTRRAFWSLLVVGPLLLPAAIALSPLLLIPLSMWVFIRGQHAWEQRRLTVQRGNDQTGLVFVNAQGNSAQGAMFVDMGNTLHPSHHPQVLNLHGEIILLVFPNGEASRAREYIRSTLASYSGHLRKPEMIVLKRS